MRHHPVTVVLDLVDPERPGRWPRRVAILRSGIERIVFEVRTEIANLCQQMADKNGEPPLDVC